MKKSVLFLLLISVSFTFSQNNDERKIGEFYKLQTYDLLKINLIKSDVNKVIVNGEHPNYVVVKNKNGNLKIRMSLEKRLGGSETKVDLYYKSIYRIEAKEGSMVFSKDTIEEPSLYIKSESGATVSAKIKTTDLNANALTGGKISLSGAANHNEIKAVTGGQVLAKNLITETTQVLIKAGGLVNVYATSFLEIDLKAGGEVNVFHKTNKIVEKITLGGIVNYLYN
mgnify:CR=1 FL=1|tara:strand:- start:1823 stop:2500 length:678 start_codon:yes stop_codon:yes gene_type:complete